MPHNTQTNLSVAEAMVVDYPSDTLRRDTHTLIQMGGFPLVDRLSAVRSPVSGAYRLSAVSPAVLDRETPSHMVPVPEPLHLSHALSDIMALQKLTNYLQDMTTDNSVEIPGGHRTKRSRSSHKLQNSQLLQEGGESTRTPVLVDAVGICNNTLRLNHSPTSMVTQTDIQLPSVSCSPRQLRPMAPQEENDES